MSDQTTAPTVHKWTGPTGVKFVDVREPSGTYYREGTPRAVIDALEDAHEKDLTVRLFLGDSQTGKEWNEENDVVGRIGRSMGRIQIPILLPKPSSNCGGAILCDSIVRLLVQGRGEVYRHPQYKDPVIIISRREEPIEMKDGRTLLFKATIDGEEHANFASEQKAQRWKDFMLGKRMNH